MPIYKKINKNFFKKWSHDMAYVLGFLFADGNIIKNKRGAHFISFYSADLILLESIKRVLNSDHKITRRKSFNLHNYSIQIGSKEIYSDLIKLGLKEKKTHRMEFPKMKREYFSDFLRGYFDGDGNVWVGEIHKERKTKHQTIRTSFTSCSFEFLKSLQDHIFKITTHLGSLVKGRGNYYRLTYSSQGSFNLYEIMYNNSQSPLFLKRKRVIFARYFKNK